VGDVLALPLPEHHGRLAAVQKPARLGRLRGVAYATISLLFWFVGLIPDLARCAPRHEPLREDRLRHAGHGWRGSARHWHNYESAYLMLAGLATPLVVSVSQRGQLRFRRRHHSPGTRRSSALFRGGGDLSGFAMVLTLAIPLRAIFGLKDFITDRHLQNMAKGDARQRPHRRLRLPGRDSSWPGTADHRSTCRDDQP